MIPKIIHYCWFGNNEIPESERKNIETWRKYCPDYEIIEWNEKNYDVRSNLFISEAYDEKKYSFVSDYARLDVIYRYGGIYLDTDVELIKNMDDLLVNQAFISTENFGKLINPGSGFGAHKNNNTVNEFLNVYRNLRFVNEDGVLNMTPITCLLTPIMIKKGFNTNNTLQIVDGLTIYPTDYFCPKDYDKKLRITSNTYSIHHFAGSWIDNQMKKDAEMKARIQKICGKEISLVLWYIINMYRRNGILKILRRFPKMIKRYSELKKNK